MLPAPVEAEAGRCVSDFPLYPSVHAFALLLALGQESFFFSWL
jgi:hypothetical protein